MKRNISPRVIERLTFYLRSMEDYDSNDYVSSKDIAHKLGYTDAQVRKDLSSFGEFGIRGKGYNIGSLSEKLKKILGLDKKNKIVIVGAGRLGSALLNEPDLTRKAFKIVGAFDIDKNKIGKKYHDIVIKDINFLKESIKEIGVVDIAILTVPKSVAQVTVDNLIKCKILAIMNFAPIQLEGVSGIAISNIDLNSKLQELNYWKEQLK